MIRLGAVGDVVRTLPAAASLRSAYPGSHLAWLVEPPAASVLECQAWIDEVLVFPREALTASLRRLDAVASWREAWGFAAALRRRRFDLVLDFHSILRSGLLSRLSGARRRVAYARPFGRELAYLFANHRARLAPARVSRFERNAGLLRYLGLDPTPGVVPLRPDAVARARMRAQLPPGPPPVVIHPGSSDATPYKRYGVEGYASVARSLAKEDGIASIVSCGPARDDREYATAVVEVSRGAARLAPPTPSLADLAALFAGCRLYIGGDTGPIHVASLVGTPVVQILGPTDPVENAPWPDTPSRSVRVPLACSPCRRGCGPATCMRAIPPRLVLEAVRGLLAEGGAAGRPS